MSATTRVGTGIRHDAVDATIRDAFAGQRARLLTTARALPPGAWTAATRCEAWNAHQLVLHLVGATEACTATLSGRRPVFAGGDFDPNSSPNAYVDRHRDEPIGETLGRLGTGIDAAVAAVDALGAAASDLEVTAVWGDPVDWRLFVVHMFWDGWLHERDLLLPAGREPEVVDAEARLATTYGLLTAAVLAGILGGSVDATLDLAGPGGGTFRVAAAGRDVTITVAAPGAGTSGEAVAVADSLAGRGPDLADVLHAPPEVVADLGHARRFLRADAASPDPPSRG